MVFGTQNLGVRGGQEEAERHVRVGGRGLVADAKETTLFWVTDIVDRT